jgi:hypothetical protein
MNKNITRHSDIFTHILAFKLLVFSKIIGILVKKHIILYTVNGFFVDRFIDTILTQQL